MSSLQSSPPTLEADLDAPKDAQQTADPQPTLSAPQPAPSSQPEQPVSKNQLKKLLKRQRWLEARPERRRVERDKAKAKRRAQAQTRAQLASNEETGKQPVSSFRRTTLMGDSSNTFRVVVDMDFEDFMTPDETSKAAQQVGRIYAANRHCRAPCQLYVSSLRGKIKDTFEHVNAGYKSWDVNFSHLNYDQLFAPTTGATSGALGELVYLSGDASDNLPPTDEMLANPSTVFVIGGLVDHNRHKNLCHQRALERGVKTAKLPIREHVTLNQRHILSTVAVFEILLQVLGERKSWAEALLSCIPKRKIASSGGDQRADGAVAELADSCDNLNTP